MFAQKNSSIMPSENFIMKLLLPTFIGNYSYVESKNVIITKNDNCGSNNLREQKKWAHINTPIIYKEASYDITSSKQVF